MNEVETAAENAVGKFDDQKANGNKQKRKMGEKRPEPVSDKPTESKAERFRRLANKRVRKAMQYIGYVANLGNKASYEYTPEQANRIISALEKALDDVTKAFTTSKDREEGFEL